MERMNGVERTFASVTALSALVLVASLTAYAFS
ncbi:hypothetical protein ACVIHI_000263 [Bradyrhizobium sp. USDA 4524]|nr:hypothetical protein [Bradyrhizobium sp. USDA 4538]MCP1898932.1 hypothetical protein [Bradyrhizobium sp. USDA 4537]MCP1909428.1 hypothetical protein [Bradyrhizobium elkanii]MCP1986954.1 hypothetical protein [Bradyrhizobium sp. USDA 4539]